MSDTPAAIPRRDFLGRVALAGAVLAAPPIVHAAPAPGDWDNRWLDGLTRKHRVIFDTKTWGGGEAFGYPKRYYDAMQDGYGTKPADIQVVIGLHGTAWPLGLADEAWAAWPLGEVVAINEPGGQGRATRNLTRSDEAGAPYAQTSLASWQKRGASILLCNNTLMRVSRELAAKRDGAVPDAVYAELRRAIIPGVTLVPAMVAAMALAQAKGASYIVGS
ncbi:MAG: twin-arginine translocation signal domain-containing protein [Gemmatimonadales bacterium]